jgi:ATP-dependent exoDNAse (exonuclease V) beta subunit
LADHFNLRTGQLRAGAKCKYKPAVKVTTELPAVERTLEASHVGEKLSDAIDRARQVAAREDVEQDSLPLAHPIAHNASARRHFSVSRLSGQLENTNLALDAGANEDAMPMSGDAAAALGTMTHRALAQLDFATKTDISVTMQRLGDLHPQAAEHTPVMEQMLRTFIDSPRAKSLATARTIHRELEFLLAWPPDAVPNGSPPHQEPHRYLRGFIDCLYQDAGEDWHLLDYKTNRIDAENVSTAAGQYEMQLGIYALAAEKILGRPPVELVLSFIRPSVEHHFRWDAAMRSRVVEQVNQAIAALVNDREQCESLAAV